jgi:DNA-binding GntR family transcriptional regulator
VTGAARLVLVTATRLDLDLDELAEAHVPILAACEAGDVGRAAEELRRHLPRYHVEAVGVGPLPGTGEEPGSRRN